jgi:DNA-binding NtrC family response regulator
VRELQNTVERAVILSDPGMPVGPGVLGLAPVQEERAAVVRDEEGALAPDSRSVEPPAREPDSEPTLDTLAEVERVHILRVLEACGGNRTRAAEVLDISIRTLRNKLHEYRAASV